MTPILDWNVAHQRHLLRRQVRLKAFLNTYRPNFCINMVTRTRWRSPIPSSSSIPSRGLPRHVEAPVSEYEGKTDGNVYLSPTGHKGPVSVTDPVFVIQNLPGCPEAGLERRIVDFAAYTWLNLKNRQSRYISGWNYSKVAWQQMECSVLEREIEEIKNW